MSQVIKVLRSFLYNISTLIFSFVLALAIWSVAIRDQDPVITKSFELDIDERGILPGDSIGVLTKSENLVRITVEGPQSIINDVTRGDLSAYIDLANLSFDSEQADVIVELEENDGEVAVVFQQPTAVGVAIEEIITLEVPIVVQVRGTAARGHTADDPLIDPGVVAVTGPESRVSTLQEARITVFMEQPREDLVLIRQPTFYDRELNVVSANGLQVNTDEVQVVIPINEIAGLAEKPITVAWSGIPAAGYRLLNVSVEPDSLIVSGPPDTISALRSVETEPIDITGLNTSFSQSVALTFPDQVIPDEVQPVVVTIEIAPIFTTDTISRIPEIRALGEGLIAELSDEDISISLFGPLPALESIGANDVTVTLDLLDLGPGEYSLAPIINITVGEVELRSTDPEFITVTILEPEEQTEGESNDLTGESLPLSTPTEGEAGEAATPVPTATSTP